MKNKQFEKEDLLDVKHYEILKAKDLYYQQGRLDNKKRNEKSINCVWDKARSH